MFYTRTPFVRSACLVAVSAAVSFTVIASVNAQQRDARTNVVAAVGQPQPPPVLNPSHPDTYVVVSGDTLWDIAAMFLRDPWYWPEIWQINPQVENPHLIYPGDILSLAYLDDGRPVIQVERGPSGVVERLSPRVRVQPLEEAISTIPYETLRSFLSRPMLLDREQLDTAPYLFAHREGLMGSSGRDVYARGTDAAEGSVFNVVHRGKELVDPDDGDVLGYEGIYVGQGRVRRSGDPATIYLLDSTREALAGDYLLNEEVAAPFNFLPRPPEQEVEGRIISVIDGVSLVGQYQVVAINRGTRHGLEPGHVLRAFRTGEVVRDEVRRRSFFAEKVRLPDESAGTMMVFRTFDRMSYALVMDATDAIQVLDTVRNP
jgi:LysM repeat protein